MDIARAQWPTGRLAHCIYPAWEVGEFTSLSRPGAIALAFSEQHAATIRIGGRIEDRDVPGGSYALSPERLEWLRVKQPSECIEVQAPKRLRRAMAEELGVASHADLADIHGRRDPIIWSIAARLRAGVRSPVMDDGERDFLVRLLYSRAYQLNFGGRLRESGFRLDERRIRRLADYVEAHLDRLLDIDELAEVAALSPYHFIRCFRATFGTTPYRFVRMRRLERARSALAAGASIRRAAHQAGYISVHHFRSSFADHFGRRALTSLRPPAERRARSR
jgi:AraC family transcriptional regulator